MSKSIDNQSQGVVISPGVGAIGLQGLSPVDPPTVSVVCGVVRISWGLKSISLKTDSVHPDNGSGSITGPPTGLFPAFCSTNNADTALTRLSALLRLEV